MRFKKIMAGVLASAMTFTAGILPNITPVMQRSMTASAEEELKYGDYLFYEKVDEDYDDTYDFVNISRCDTSAVSVKIPSEIDGLPVTSIGSYAFYDCESLASVTIPDSVTSIGERAFSDCRSLASVTIPDSVTSIGDWAFDVCKSLENVTIGNSVTTIGYSAFSYCESLENITIGNSVTTIGELAFYDCESLASVTIPDSVTTIGDDAFYLCTSLSSIDVTKNNKYYSSINGVLFNKDKTKLIQYPAGNKNTTYTIPDSVTTIVSDAFSSCHSLESITIPDSVTEIGSTAFSYCESLTSITIPDSVTTIANGAFWRCPSLESVKIPDSVTSIGNLAFSECESLESVKIPDSVTTIGGEAFSYCRSLASITIPDSVTSIGDGAFSETALLNNQTGAIKYVGTWVVDCYGEDITSEIEIKEGTKRIADGAFSYCYYLVSVTIPDSVTSIGKRAFERCPSLESVTIPDSVTTIGDGTFSSCTSLVSVTIGNSVTTIGEEAFSECTSLSSITIPDSVTFISSNTFSGTALFDNQTGVKYVDTWVIGYDENITSAVEIKEGAKGIVDKAFSACMCLESITIPDSVTFIGGGAFSECYNLKSIVIPDSVTTIDDGAFSNCQGLESVTIGNSVTTIGDNVFFYCISLSSIDVTKNNKYYSSIDGVLFNKDKTKLIQYPACKIETIYTIPDSVTEIGDYAFYYCKSLSSIRIFNPDCKIYDSEYTIANAHGLFGCTIYGHENSTAQKYAEKYDKNFALIGDINYDGKISVADIVLLQNALVKKDELNPRMELNGDDKINVFDLIILKRKVIYG